MGTYATSLQHPEIGSVAMRMLWIPAVASIAVAAFLLLRAPHDNTAPAAVGAAYAAAPAAQAAPSGGAAPQQVEAVAAAVDEATAAHQALDPVGAGHDAAR